MKTILHLFYFIIIFLNLGVCGFSLSYISEINFIGDEFVEIYSEDFFNLSNSIVIDESLKNNSLDLVKLVNDSNFYLVVGSNFISSNSLDNLNCSVYVSSGTQVSHGGLKSSGENFSIGNFSFNLSLGKNYDFEVGESLSIIDGINYVLPSSVCGFSSLNLSVDVPDENLNTSVSCGDYDFNLVLRDEIVSDKVEFKFNTNYSGDDYLVNYWIEDYSGEIVKDIRNSSSLNWKSYTPKGLTQILQVFGELEFESCSLNVSEYVYFYSSDVESKSSVSKSKISSTKVQESLDLPSDSYVKLLNLDLVLNFSNDFLEYELYRGESRKSVVNFYLNSKNILKLRLDDFENISGRVFIDVENYDYLRVVGLDYDEKFNFSILNLNSSLNSEKNIKLSKTSKQFFSVGGISQNKDKINVNVSSNIVDLENICYVSKVRTVVSNLVNNVTGNLSINLLKLDKISDGDNLKLLCKYRKVGLKTWSYESKEFIYSKSYILDFVNNSIELYSNYKNFDEKLVENKVVDVSSFSPVSGKVVYSNKNINFLETSSFFVLVGLMVLMIPMLILW
jgi:hypothetical protein